MIRNKLSLLVLILLTASVAYGKQQLSVEPDETLNLSVLDAAYNRLFIQGERIASIRGLPHQYDVEKDEVHGEIYLRLHSADKEEPVSVFLTTERGQHYHLLLRAQPFAEAVTELVPVKKAEEREPSEELRAEKETVSPLVDFVYRGLDETTQGRLNPQDRSATFAPQKQGAWTLALNQVLHNDDYQGWVYTVTNNSEQSQSLRVSHFHTEKVKAIGFAQTRVEPQGSTQVLIVREREKIDEKIPS
jgi:type-F conjugative transfer system secretin TraK